MDYLTPIFERKRREVLRRRRHRLQTAEQASAVDMQRGLRAVAALRRPSAEPPRIIGEIKRRSPSRGELRAFQRGDVAQLSRAYVAGGATAVSVLCDGPGFGGSPLDVRRATNSVSVPVLFKEFVLDELQIEVARAVGAHMVLLLVRALSPVRLAQLVDATCAAGMAPVVEAADAGELARALETKASIVGVNARDLRSFCVDTDAAQRALANIPSDRVAVHMSGVHTRADFAAIARGRADAVLIGESLMRAESPTQQLREFLG